MKSIPEINPFDQVVSNSIKSFCKKYKLSTILKNGGCRKQRGFPALQLVQYVLSLAFLGRTMNTDLKYRCPKENPKDAVYRLLRSPNINWNAILLKLAAKIIKFMDTLTSGAQIIDNSRLKSLRV